MSPWGSDLPAWATRVLIWVLAGILVVVANWVSALPTLQQRVQQIEEAQREIREEIRGGFRDLTARIDRLMNHPRPRGD